MPAVCVLRARATPPAYHQGTGAKCEAPPTCKPVKPVGAPASTQASTCTSKHRGAPSFLLCPSFFSLKQSWCHVTLQPSPRRLP